MNREQLMNQQCVELLKTIRKENPSLRLYMTDLLNEMDDPESAFNTGRISKLSDLDRLTTIRLCDAFAVAKKYSEKYHLDLSELIEFVSEKTIEITLQNKVKSAEAFKVQIERLIRQQFPFRNPLILRSGRQNILSYEMYDEGIKSGDIDNNRSYWDKYAGENPELNIPILFTRDFYVAYSEMETNLEKKQMREIVSKALELLTPKEEKVIRLRFGFEDGIPHDLDQVGRCYGVTRERIRQIEAKALRKLHSRKVLSLLGEFIDENTFYHVPTRFVYARNNDRFNSLICWQPYCICKHQMRYQQSVLVDDKTKMVFYCRNCGRIYELKNKRLKRISQYCLKGYTLDSTLDKESWPMFHWDRTTHNDFKETLMKFYVQGDIKRCRTRIESLFGTKYDLKEMMIKKMYGIYGLVIPKILSRIDAENCTNLLIEEYSVQE